MLWPLPKHSNWNYLPQLCNSQCVWISCGPILFFILMYVLVSNYNPEGDDWEQVDGGLQYLAIPVNNQGIKAWGVNADGEIYVRKEGE